ncbi:MAG TPA: quinone-dependent dihydroorotate dehydrogenase [Calditrichia bacterium]|nr:quinone-dependent dihydroorotate dehydrogenase [Calditrichota bacterium]HQU73351.1 quinone-dependent dihydroorotate dehydrogenase [Calditrichia bacterium]HQV30542.1 quinone-dependent dihydroorotate dehydrogenase [Calditrichia bacterium]
MYRLLIQKLLFLLEPETAHHVATRMLKLPLVSRLLGWLYRFEHPALAREVFGIRFPNPIGLAAGFDKEASFYREMGQLGFGFVEIGTVTPKGQPGNPKPRLFRLKKDRAIINRMGFNNAGLAAAQGRLRSRKPGLIIGGNIGKNKLTPNEKAVDDYLTTFEGLYDLVDYFVVNVSSPNTPNLRALQEKGPLLQLLKELQIRNSAKPEVRPILLKIAPDLSNEQLDDIIEIVQETGIAGVIATNTTIAREPLQSDPAEVDRIGAGGLSGAPLRQRATEVIAYLHDKSRGAFPIIGVGGIDSPEAALEKLRAGASLIQVYSGFIYEGPALLRDIKKRLVEDPA